MRSLCLIWAACLAVVGAETSAVASVAPEFTQTEHRDWINSAPLTLDDLSGGPAIIEFWTFGCINCRRSIPWVNSLLDDYADAGLTVVGIHTPEFNYERSPDEVARRCEMLVVEHPVMIDNDHAYWNAMGNRYWPAFYLLDARGVIRGRFIGETHVGDRQDQAVRGALDALIADR